MTSRPSRFRAGSLKCAIVGAIFVTSFFAALPVGAVITTTRTAPRTAAFGLDGKVTKVSSGNKSFTVTASIPGLQTKKGKSYVVKTTKTTHYVSTKGGPATFSSLKVGKVVVVEGTATKSIYTAYAVGIST